MNAKNEEKHTGAAGVALDNGEETVERMTLEQLQERTRVAFKAFYALNEPRTREHDRQRLIDIIDALEDNLCEKMTETGYGDNVALRYISDNTLTELIGSDPLKCFVAGLAAYGFNPYDTKNKKNAFIQSAQYVALDGHLNICSIDSREDLACWYECEISDYLSGNYGEPDADTLQALAEVFGADYDNEDEEGGEA